MRFRKNDVEVWVAEPTSKLRIDGEWMARGQNPPLEAVENRRGFDGMSYQKSLPSTKRIEVGFYKHFRSKDDLLVESLSEAFREFTDTLVRAAEQTPSGAAFHAWPANRGQRTGVLFNFFNDNGSN